MKKKQAIIAFSLALFVQFCFAQKKIESNDLQKSMSRIVESSHVKLKGLGLVVADPSRQIIYELNSDQKMMPASLTKISTAASILEGLPVGHQFKTELLGSMSAIKENILNGDLYLRGGGDAGFVSESMWFLVNEFMRSGISKINGNIIVDDSRFDQVRFDPSRDQDRVDRAYDAPIGAMTFNWSAVNIFVRPGAKVGDPARVISDPLGDYIRVVNKTKTAGSGKKINIEVSNNGLSPDKKHEDITVSGTIANDSSEFVAYKSIAQPEIWAGYNLREFLKQRSIVVTGDVKSGVTPSGATVLATNKSKPVGHLVADMMKFSNNYIAEILTKNLAVETKGAPGTMDKGIDVIRNYLREKKLNESSEIYNPSGLSRKNRFTPKSLLTILQNVQENFRVYPEYLTGFPIAGVDGTLKRRLGGENLSGHVRAKTGHLAGVAGLGGYVSASEGQVYTFVFLYNGTPDEAYRAQELFDKLITEVLKTH